MALGSARSAMLMVSASVCMLVLIGTAGCWRSSSPGVVHVSGRVTIEGKPLERGAVRFTPDGPGRPAVGVIEAGRFTMSLTQASPGVVKGKYRVSIVSREPVPTDWQSRPTPPAPKSLIPERYEDTALSGLAIEVTAPVRDLTFDLKSQ